MIFAAAFNVSVFMISATAFNVSVFMISATAFNVSVFMISATVFNVSVFVTAATAFNVFVFVTAVTAYNLKQKNGFILFYFIFFGVEAVRFSRLWRLIERVVDSGFVVQKNPKHHFCITSIKRGYRFQNHQTLLGKNVPRL